MYKRQGQGITVLITSGVLATKESIKSKRKLFLYVMYVNRMISCKSIAGIAPDFKVIPHSRQYSESKLFFALHLKQSTKTSSNNHNEVYAIACYGNN